VIDIKSFFDIQRLRNRDDSEHEQATIRVVILGLCSLYVLFSYLWGPLDSDQYSYIVMIMGYWLFSIVLLVHIMAFPYCCPARRYCGITGDMMILSIAIYAMQDTAAILFPLYLWVSIGYGLRFGQQYLYIAMLQGVSGFSVALLNSSYWEQHMSAGIGILISLIALPLYFSALMSRLHKANLRLNALLARTKKMATEDSLTHLPNRALFFDRLSQSVTMAKRQHTMFAVLFLDLDGFKLINDNRGHAAGDHILRNTAERLRESVRHSDTVARIGGDEFVLILNNIHETEAVNIASKLIHLIERPFTFNDKLSRISASVGIAMFPRDGTSTDDLINHADIAMYEAKQSGKNQYRLYAKAAEGQFTIVR